MVFVEVGLAGAAWTIDEAAAIILMIECSENVVGCRLLFLV